MSSRSIVVVFSLVLAVSLLAACGSLPEQKFTEDKLYAGVIAFSDTPIDLEMAKRTGYFFRMIEGRTQPGELSKKALITKMTTLREHQNTTMVYTLDKALDLIEEIQSNQPRNPFSADPSVYYYTKYYIVLFTDGLDNASVQAAANDKRGNYANSAEYAEQMRKRMNAIFKKKKSDFLPALFNPGLFPDYFKPARQNTFEIFLLGLLGKDMRDSGYTDQYLVDSLNSLVAGYSSDPRQVVLHQPIVSSDTHVIYNEFRKSFTASNFSFSIPKGFAENNYRVRMEFKTDGEADFIHWFEADFEKRRDSVLKSSYVLTYIRKSPGFNFDHLPEIKEIPGTSNAELQAHFAISNLRLEGSPFPIKENRQLYFDRGSWRINSEFDSEKGQYKNAYVLLVLDRSSSLKGAGWEQSEQIAEDIIDLLSGPETGAANRP